MAAVLVAGTAGAVYRLSDGGKPPRPDASFAAVVQIGAPSHTAPVRLVSAPGGATSGAGSIWVTEPDASEIVRIDPRSGSIVDRVPMVGSPGPIAFAAGACG